MISISNWGPDAAGYQHIVGEVQNTGTENAEFVQINFNFYNASNVLLTTDFTFTDLNVLAPGERSGFADIFMPPAGYDHYAVGNISAQAATGPLNHNFTTQVTNVFTDVAGFQHIVGTVTNNNTTTDTYVEVLLTFRDCSGTVVDSDFTFIKTGLTSSLGPTPASASFELIRLASSPAFRTASLATQANEAASPYALPAPTSLATPPDPPTHVNAAARVASATVTWTTPVCTGGAALTGYTVTSSPGNYTAGVGPGSTSATVSGLPNGTYTFSVVASNSAGTSAASVPSNPITLPPVAVLAAMANGAYGGYTTVAEIQNVGAGPASVSITYVDSSGNTVGAGDSIANLPVGGTWAVRQDNGRGLSGGQAGSALVFSDQPLATFVNEFAPGGSDATSYSGISLATGMGTTLYAPAIANNAYGGYTTGIGLVNVGSGATTVTITYRDTGGMPVKTQTLNSVAAGAYQGVYSGAAGLPTGFAGTATITSSVGPVAAIVNETGPGGQFSSYDAVPLGSMTLFAPAALDNAFGGFFTGMGIQNTTASNGTVIVTYYDSTGLLASTTTHAIAANGYLGIYQGTDLTTPGAYTAKITSTVAVAAIVNEVAPSSTSAKQSTAYNTFAAGAGTLHLPLVENAGPDGWSTGEGFMNTGSMPTTVQVSYHDTTTGALVGTTDVLTLQPNAFWGLYQPAGGLPSGTRASAVVFTSLGGQVAAICNESNATTFMSYSGQ